VINLTSCPSCGLQFELREGSGRCPTCGTRVSKSEEPARAGAASVNQGQVFVSSGGRVGFATLSQFNPTGWILGLIASSILFPILLTSGLIAAIFGAAFDIQALLIVGGVGLAVAAAMLIYFLWKLIAGIRRAAGLLKDVTAQVADLSDIDGTWRRTDDAP